MAQCVFCEKSENLNTNITISLDGGKKVVVDICDEHSDDATPKLARAAYLKRENEADELKAKLKAMGYDVSAISKTQAGLTVASIPAPLQAPTQRQQVHQLVQALSLDDLEGDDVVTTELLDSKDGRGLQSKGGMAGAHSVSSYSNHAVRGINIAPDEAQRLAEARRGGKAKLTVVEGREGMPLLIPEKRVDGTGTTRLKITKKETDNTLQTRFKRMAADSNNNNVPNFARAGYQNTQTDCPICKKSPTPGIIVQNGKEVLCPKCNGAGIISTY